MLYIVRSILEMKTPLHCGEKSFDLSDAPVTLDSFGLWRIPGTSVAGVLRAWTKKHLPEYEDPLFGTRDKRPVQSSAVWCSDALLLDYDHVPAWRKIYEGKKPDITIRSCSRDHVCLDLDTGSSVAGGKFDEEYVPSGVRFSLEVSLDINEQAKPNIASAFATVVQALKDGRVHFGAHANYGYGEYSVVAFECRQYDLTKPEDVEAWLSLKDDPLFNDPSHEWQPKTMAEQNVGNAISGTVTIPFTTENPILIGGGAPTDTVDADLCFAQTYMANYTAKTIRGVLVLPGSSLRGVIRHRIYQILSDIGHKQPQNALDNLFGMSLGKNSKPGKLGFQDATLYCGKQIAEMNNCSSVQHVSIDRFTGGAMDAHLFNEAPIWQNAVSFSLTIRLSALTPEETGLLLQSLLDMAEGKIGIGNGVNRGNGRVLLADPSAIRCHLFWNNEELTEKDTGMARTWLANITAAYKEKWNAQTV